MLTVKSFTFVRATFSAHVAPNVTLKVTENVTPFVAPVRPMQQAVHLGAQHQQRAETSAARLKIIKLNVNILQTF